MTDATHSRLAHLPPAAAGLGATFARPRVLAAACVVVLAGLGWLYLGLMAASSGGMGGALESLCRPVFGSATTGAADAALVTLMWSAMALAMMLPSAAPMILTYAEIADTAAGKGERIVSPFVLAAGYTVVWLGFAAAATLAQILMMRASWLTPAMTPASALLSGAIFIGAGFYQFSTLKHTCLTQCQRPFPYLFTNWATTTQGVFRLGLKQGAFCLGCCWAMMLVMFAVGVMNVVWMAGLGAVMTIEKLGSGRRFAQVVGVTLIAVGIVFVLSAAGWPLRLS